MDRLLLTQTDDGGDPMLKGTVDRQEKTPTLRLEPEKRLCPAFDPVSIAKFPVAAPGEMGVRVLDDFCEEHIQ
jgi:hypothetical protein